MTEKAIAMSGDLRDYVVGHSIPRTTVHTALVAETNARFADRSNMLTTHEQGALLTFLVRLIGARTAIEVGTFTGYSALNIAQGLPADGRLICCDVSDEFTSVGKPYWEQAGVADRIDLRIAPAAETLAAITDDGTVDFAFIDADKPGYPTYFEHLVRLLRPGGLLVVDNVFWGGDVVRPEVDDDTTNTIRAFNDLVAGDDRVESVMVNVADGLTLIRKR